MNSFNINIYSDESALQDFRFQIKDIARVSDAMGWNAGKTVRNGYNACHLQHALYCSGEWHSHAGGLMLSTFSTCAHLL